MVVTPPHTLKNGRATRTRTQRAANGHPAGRFIMLGTSIWQLLYAHAHGVAGKPIGLAMLAEYLVMGPFFVFSSFISIFSPLFIALSLLNTWHFRKIINRQPNHSDLQSGIA